MRRKTVVVGALGFVAGLLLVVVTIVLFQQLTDHGAMHGDQSVAEPAVSAPLEIENVVEIAVEEYRKRSGSESREYQMTVKRVKGKWYVRFVSLPITPGANLLVVVDARGEEVRVIRGR